MYCGESTLLKTTNASVKLGAKTLRGDVLVVTTLKIRQPAAAAPAAPAVDADSYSARGSVGSYRSAADFKVQGQDIDAATAE